MCHRISTLKKIVGQLSSDSELLSLKDLSSLETEVLAKLANIVSYVKDIEEKALKVRQDLLKRTTFEGRESDKIRAVKGNVISNKKKYYKNLEEDIESLTLSFAEQSKKIQKEIQQLQVLSQGKMDFYFGSSGETIVQTELSQAFQDPNNFFTPKNIPSTKTRELPTIKSLKSNEAILKEKFTRPLTLKTEKEASLKFNLESIGLKSSEKLKTINEGNEQSPSKYLFLTNSNNCNTLPKTKNIIETPLEGAHFVNNKISEDSRQIKKTSIYNFQGNLANQEDLGQDNFQERPVSSSFYQEEKDLLLL